MALFPTSPINGEIFVRDSIPYIYNSTDNKWTITTDSDLVASNIKTGIDILGVTGTLDPAPTTPTGEINHTSTVTMRSRSVYYRTVGTIHFIMSADSFRVGGDDGADAIPFAQDFAVAIGKTYKGVIVTSFAIAGDSAWYRDFDSSFNIENNTKGGICAVITTD